MRDWLLSITAIALIAASGAATAAECVLPIPDGGDIAPSPASLVGRIVSVAPGKVSVRHADSAEIVRVNVGPYTEFFSVYGGGFKADQLAPGQYTLIWFKDCVTPKRGSPSAAVLQICSRDPEPCPK